MRDNSTWYCYKFKSRLYENDRDSKLTWKLWKREKRRKEEENYKEDKNTQTTLDMGSN